MIVAERIFPARLPKEGTAAANNDPILKKSLRLIIVAWFLTIWVAMQINSVSIIRYNRHNPSHLFQVITRLWRHYQYPANLPIRRFLFIFSRKLLNMKVHASLTLLLLFLIPIIGFSQGKMEKIKLLDGKLELMVPARLSPMTDAMWSLKYGNRKKPDLALSDPDGEVNLVGTLTPQTATEEHLSDFKTFQKDALKKTHPEMEFLGDGIREVNGKKIGYFKFLAAAVDQKTFNEYFFLIIEGKIMICSFNCPEKMRKEWEKAADEIIGSLKVS
jgi:hypothetical protein